MFKAAEFRLKCNCAKKQSLFWITIYIYNIFTEKWHIGLLHNYKKISL